MNPQPTPTTRHTTHNPPPQQTMKVLLIALLSLLFISSSYAATRTISDAGGNWGDAGTWVEGAAPTSSDDVVVQSDGTSGNVTINAPASCKSIVFTNYTGTLTHNSGVTLTVGDGNITFVSGMTYTLGDNTATITHTANYKTFNGVGKTFGTVNLNPSTNIAISGANTFATLTITGSASKLASLQLNADQTITGTFTCNGNSITNRIIVFSNTLGTVRTITAATVSVTNADFQDIAGAGAGSWNLSAVSGGSGDCGGNSGITFTTTATQYWHADSGNWSNSAKWFLATNGGGGAGRVPLPQDSVVFDANSIDSASQTITADLPRLGLDINFTGVANNPAFSISDWIDLTAYGSVTFGTGMTTSTGAGTGDLTFGGGGSGSSVNLTSNSVAIAFPITLNKKTGTLTLQDDLNITINTAGDLAITQGTFNANNKDVTTGGVSSNNYLVRAITMGSGTWTLTATGTVWNVATTGTFTLTPDTSTIIINDASATGKTFAGAGKTYYNLQFTGAGTGSLTITGSNTFNDITIDTAPKTLTFTAATSTTVSTFHATGSSGNLITINSSTGGSAATLYKAGGLVSCDYLSLQDSAATGAFWFAGANSTSVSGNSGWVFTAARSQVFLKNASLNNAKISR